MSHTPLSPEWSRTRRSGGSTRTLGPQYLHSASLRAPIYGPNLMIFNSYPRGAGTAPCFIFTEARPMFFRFTANLRQRFPRLTIVGASPSTFGRITVRQQTVLASRSGNQARKSSLLAWAAHARKSGRMNSETG
jgi:hypothetical protein